MKERNDCFRFWDTWAALLVFIMITLAFSRLTATKWTVNLEIVRTISYLGLIAGFALGTSKFSPRLGTIFAIAYGLFTIPWRLGLTLPVDYSWQERLLSIWNRLLIIFTDLAQKKPVQDNLLFLILMCALFWIISLHAGYILCRKAEPWLILIPGGIALVILHSYDWYFSHRITYLIGYLFFGLILVARLTLLKNKILWEKNNASLPPNIGYDIFRVTVTCAIIFIIFAWVFPVRADSLQVAKNAWNIIKKPFQGVRDDMDNAFASIKSGVGIITDYYGSSLTLGQGNRLSEAEIFTVLTPRNPPMGNRYYWRARIYSIYNEGKWDSELDANLSLEPDNYGIQFITYPERATGQFSFFFTPSQPTSVLYVPAQPDWVSVPVKVEYLKDPEGKIDINIWRATPALRNGATYYVRSSLSGATIAKMRNGGEDYPQWVKDRYLQIPNSITDRTRQLALEITEGFETPYDKAYAITNYLRNNIEYIETIDKLPDNKELIDWFLFEYQKGFCNYYASAEVILLRLAGIPARLAVGYAQGEYQEVADAYIVRQHDAHAWPEVFFPTIGWVEFEPTTSQPILIRPTGENFSNNSARDSMYQDEEFDRMDRESLRGPHTIELSPDLNNRMSGTAIILMISLFSCLSGVVILLLIKNKNRIEQMPPTPVLLERGIRKIGINPPSFIIRWSQQSMLSKIERAYQELNHALIRLKIPIKVSDTPAERAKSLSNSLPEAKNSVEQLINEYELAVYSLYPANPQAAKKASEIIRELSYRKLFQKFILGNQ